MRRSKFCSAFILLAMMWSSLAAEAAIVRGRLLRGQGVAPGIAVTVWCQQFGRSQPTYSQADGIYYIANVPPGAYVLEVWARGNGQPPLTFNIQINEPGTDIPPVFVP